MTIDYRLLFFALLLLWTPRRLLRAGWTRSGKRRSRRHGGKDDPVPVPPPARFAAELAKPRNWIDLLRAAAGAYAVGRVCFDFPADASRETFEFALVLQAAALIVAVFVQMIRLDGRLTLFAPVFFISGLMFGMLEWHAAAFALATSWIANMAVGDFGGRLLVLCGLALAYGTMLPHTAIERVFVAAFLAFLPVLVSVLVKRRFARPDRPGRLSRA